MMNDEPHPLIIQCPGEGPMEWAVSLNGDPNPERRDVANVASEKEAVELRDFLTRRFDGTKVVQVVMTKAPGPASQFVDVEDMRGNSGRYGFWIKRGDGARCLLLRVSPETIPPVTA